ncbi:MLO-like protein 9 [Silene latifolia]|uniref:MLO-like protein 9 n=1 Tax=Silene latifolia TaxID=37657 RepID=UPI003D77DEF5
MSGGSSGDGRTLNQTPTWAVAGVCALIVLISIVLEKGLHSLGMLLKKKHKAALYEALDKVKGELMVLGFISLLLTFSQNYITAICIPSKAADTMLPCLLNRSKSSASGEEHGRRLLWDDHRRILVTKASNNKCNEGYEPLIAVEAAHQLHILIFFLALFHVLYSALTMMLGKLKIRGWKIWERETLTLDYECTNDPSRLRLTHETSFVKTHNSFWARTPFFFYVGCFFRQFFKSVTKADYLALRNGFITAHIAPGGKFNFQKYIKRSLEDDFKVVVGVSPVLWASFVIFLLLNVNGWHTLLWASILPLIAILAIGTKLQAILTKMALEITDRHSVVQGIPLVQGSDSYFWFSKPRLILHLLHFTLFQNAFQITYFLWILYEFGSESCFHDKPVIALLKIIMGLGAMVLCSYSILPLYALVTQMGSHMKKTIFDEQTTKALKKWHKDVKKKQEDSDKTPPRILEKTTSPLKRPSLHRFMSTGCLSNASVYDRLDPCDYHGDERSMSETLVIRLDNDQDENEMTTIPNGDEITRAVTDDPQFGNRK